MAFPDTFMDELVVRNDIADVVSGYVQLTRKGGNLFGLCPFHSEKTPSFSVSPEKQIYHCFGCGKGGGVINFIMEIENLPFPDAVRFLARRAGLTVPEQEESVFFEARRAPMLELNRCAARFYHEMLGLPQGSLAADYIGKRGLSGRTVKCFGLGAAPDAWDALITAMAHQGFDKAALLSAGLAVKNKNGNIYDRFRNRLMFPIINIRGEVIGFGGRVLDDSLPKYLNSPESLVFSKSKNLFAMNVAKKSKQGRIILTEGYMDALALHQAGFDCAVASLGTSLTTEHARLLAHYTKEVVIAYDGDAAGLSAAQRAISILGKTGVALKVLRMQGAKDPDEYIKKFGRDAFQVLLERSENHIEYRLLQIQAKYNLAADEQKVDYLKEVIGLLAGLGPVEREVYGARVAEVAGITALALQHEVKQATQQRIQKEKKKQTRRDLAPVSAHQPKERAMRYENIRSAVAEEGVLRLMSLEPSLFDGAERLEQEEFSSPFLARVYAELLKHYREGRSTLISGLTEQYTPEEMSHLTSILQKPESITYGKQALDDYINIIKTENSKRTGGTEDDSLLAARAKYREKMGYGG